MLSRYLNCSWKMNAQLGMGNGTIGAQMTSSSFEDVAEGGACTTIYALYPLMKAHSSSRFQFLMHLEGDTEHKVVSTILGSLALFSRSRARTSRIYRTCSAVFGVNIELFELEKYERIGKCVVIVQRIACKSRRLYSRAFCSKKRSIFKNSPYQ